MKYIAPQPWHQSNEDSQEIEMEKHQDLQCLYSPTGLPSTVTTRCSSGHKPEPWKKAKSGLDRGGANYLPLPVPLEYTKVQVK